MCTCFWISVKELPNFMRKYYLIAELLIFEYRWQNISISCFGDLSVALYFSTGQRSAHRARETMQLLTCETPDFIAPALWPANSPDHAAVTVNPVDYRSVCIAAMFMMLTTWGHTWSKSGNISTRCSSMERSGSGIHVFELAFEHTEDILNTDFSYVWYLYRRTLCLCSCL